MTAPTRPRAAPRASKPAAKATATSAAKPAAKATAGSAAKPAARSDAPDLRHRILEAAADLLREEGLAALSMREVARRAGVTHQAPYHHFADREAILAELVSGGFAMLAAEPAEDAAATKMMRAKGQRIRLVGPFLQLVG